MNIWIFQTGEPLHSDDDGSRPMRAINLADVLIDRGHQVTIWSSEFYHQKKRHRARVSSGYFKKDQLTIRLIPSPGYNKNIGLGRLYDHACLAHNFSTLLETKGPNLPDAAFIGYPPIEAAFVFSNWLYKNRVPFLVDIKDQWPLIFVERVPPYLRFLAKLILLPYFILGKRTMKRATALSSISEPFLEWAQDYSGRKSLHGDIVAPLTSRLPYFDTSEKQIAKESLVAKGVNFADGIKKFCFVGSLSDAFDFEPVLEAARLFEQDKSEVQFIICGDGVQKERIQKFASKCKNIIVPGWVSECEMQVLFESSTANLAPYRNSEDFKKSIPNKCIDALMYEVPLLTSLEGELKNLVVQKGVGIIYQDVDSFRKACFRLIDDEIFLTTLQNNAKLCFAAEFNFQSIYGSFAATLENLGKKIERQTD